MTLSLTPAGVQAAEQAAAAIPLTLTPAGYEAAAAAAHLASLDEARDWWQDHPAARLPASPVINVRVKGASRAAKLADLDDIAASWGVETITDGLGTQIARLVFGGYTYEAHVAVQHKTMDELKAAAGGGAEVAA